VGDVVGADADQDHVGVEPGDQRKLLVHHVAQLGAGDAEGVQTDPVVVAQRLGDAVGEGVLGGVGADAGDRAVAQHDQDQRLGVLRAEHAAELEHRFGGEETAALGRQHLGGQRGGQGARSEQRRPADVPDSDTHPHLPKARVTGRCPAWEALQLR
jgi:hypothetical protein